MNGEATTTELAPTLGRHRPIASLGQGGMARVYLTVNEGPAGVQKLLVVKEIRPELAQDAEFLAMFMDEARLAARLSHRNVTHTYEVGIDESSGSPRPFIVMEYLEGQSLQALIARVRRDSMPLAVHLRILAGVLAGLHYAHELCDFDGTPLLVVHRDVSPHNVFVGYDGQVKLMDFGIAKAAGSASRTEAGTFKGKLGYVAPEQILGNDVDRRADLFSVGIMMWEALVKRRLTAGDSEAAVVTKRTQGAQPAVASANPDVPAALAAICDKALAQNPEDRFATAAEMKAALEEYLDTAGLRATDTEIGALVSGAFVAERERIRELLEKQIMSLSKAGSGLTSLPSLLASEGTPSLYPAVPPAAPTTTSQAPPFYVTNPYAKRPRSPTLALVAGGAAVVGLVVVFGIYLGLRAPPATEAHTATSAAAPGIPTHALGAGTATASADPTSVGIGSLPTTKPIHAITPGASSAAPTASASAKVESNAAGTDLTRDPKPKHPIDEKDPYP